MFNVKKKTKKTNNRYKYKKNERNLFVQKSKKKKFCQIDYVIYCNFQKKNKKITSDKKFDISFTSKLFKKKIVIEIVRKSSNLLKSYFTSHYELYLSKKKNFFKSDNVIFRSFATYDNYFFSTIFMWKTSTIFQNITLK